MRGLRIGACVWLALGGLALSADGAKNAPDFATAFQTKPVWHPWVEIGGYWGSGAASRGEAALWVPLRQRLDSVLFADVRGKLFEHTFAEGNFAVGYRQMLASGWNLGAWAGYDVRRSGRGNLFHQASAGVELLSRDFDARFNGYVPITGAQTGNGGGASIVVSGNQIYMTGGQEMPLYGVDGEVGLRIGGREGRSGRTHELRAYAGGFWFSNSGVAQAVAGPKARAEWRINGVFASLPESRLTFEGEYSWDPVRQDKWEVGARLRFPLGSTGSKRPAMSAQQLRMAEAIERDTDIVTVGSGSEAVEDALTGVDFDSVAFVDDGGSITTASSNAGANALIVARGGTISGGQTLQANQTLAGGATAIQVRGLTSGAVASYTAPGTMPTLSVSGGSGLDNLSLGNSAGSNVHIAGIATSGAGSGGGNDAIAVSSSNTNVFIDRVQIASPNQFGVSVDNNSAVTVIDSTFTNAGHSAIYLGNSNSLTVSGATITTPVIFGLGFITGNTVTVSGTTINAGSGVTKDAMEFSGSNTVAFNNNTLTGAFVLNGIDLNAAGNTLSGSGNVRTGASFGLFCENAGGNSGQIDFTDGSHCP